MSYLEFQITDIDANTKYNYQTHSQEFIINIFGLTIDKKKIYIKVINFKPFFYIKLPDDEALKKKIKTNNFKQFIDELQNCVKSNVSLQKTFNGTIDKNKSLNIASAYSHCELVVQKTFKEFSNYKDYEFLKLYFDDEYAGLGWARTCNKKLIMRKINGIKPIKLETYESCIPAFLRFLHIQQIDAFGWVRIDTNDLDEYDNNYNDENSL